MTLPSRKAKNINRLSFIAQYDRSGQRLYVLDNPIEYYKNTKNGGHVAYSTRYVIVSNSIKQVPEETMLFPANWRGRIQTFSELGYYRLHDKDREVLSQIEASI